MYVDFKTTVWERIFIPDELSEEVMKGVQEGSIKHYNDFYNTFPSWELESETLYDTQEVMSPIQNDGHATMEVYLSDPEGDNPAFTNAIKSIG